MTDNIAIVSDLHFGIRSDSPIFRDSQIAFFRDFFIPECKKRKIKNIIMAGDIFDKRKNINIHTLSEIRTKIFDVFLKEDFQITMLIGNHDCVFRNTNEYNSPNELLGDYDNIEIIDRNPIIKNNFVGTNDVGLMPWICPDNYDKSMGVLEESNAPCLIGHFEISGFDMHPGIPCHHGLSAGVFKRFKRVLSGHFHTRSSLGNISYLGTQYEMTWADCDDPKGFNILNSDLELEFVQYKTKMFIKIKYEDGIEINSDLKNKFVKLIIGEEKDRKKIDSVIKNIQNQEPADFKIIETQPDFCVQENLNVEVEDTQTLMEQYVDTLDMEADTINIKTILQELHKEALAS